MPTDKVTPPPLDDDASWELIGVYTRAQALGDGQLIDVSDWASAETGFMGGFRVPVAVTSSVWVAINDILERDIGIQDVRGRAHDVLFLAAHALRGAIARGERRASFRVILPHTGARNIDLIVDCGPGDEGEPVVTIGEPSDFQPFGSRSAAAASKPDRKRPIRTCGSLEHP